MNAIDKYINEFPDDIKKKLKEIREIIESVVGDAEQKIGYGMPGYYNHGPIVYFGAFKNHIGFFPTPSGVSKFMDQIQDYKHNKGTIQFPYSKPLPKKLIKDITKFRLNENLEIAKLKGKL